MKLTDFDKQPVYSAQRALKEHYGTSIDVSRMTYAQVRNMLSKVRGLMSESKESTKFYESTANSSYMKLVFMEQALSKQFAYLSTQRPRIVVENEEVEKSQTILAAQDMVDSIQKMVEQVSDMIVKELPALVDSVQSEIGVNESSSFSQQATEALTSLQAALTQSQGTMKDAVNGITGQGDMGAFDGANDMSADIGGDLGGEEDFNMDASEELPDGSEEEVDLNMDVEEPEDLGSVGRAKR
jgi:hypothetical protein